LSKLKKVSSGKVTGVGRALLEDAKYLCCFGFDLGWFGVSLVPWRSQPERFVDGGGI